MGTGAYLHRRLTPDFAILVGSHNNDDEMTDRPLALPVWLEPPQGMRTNQMDRMDGRNVAEDTVARRATRKDALGTNIKYKNTPINCRS
jgi:hypothetical protein